MKSQQECREKLQQRKPLKKLLPKGLRRLRLLVKLKLKESLKKRRLLQTDALLLNAQKKKPHKREHVLQKKQRLRSKQK
ncbi:MAG: hypothetical protein CMJ17_01265 [Phenylobacterium sp.]|nr:hypothetical protein [Phenylobacterium sp.]